MSDRVVQDRRFLAGWAAASSGHGGRADGGIVAHDADGFQRHAAGAPGGPFIGL